MNIFVYGTLRRGGAAEDKLRDSEHLGSATIRGRLYAIDWYPGVIEDAEAYEIIGDVFSVNEDTLAKLDEYEGMASGDPHLHEYIRKTCPVLCEGEKMLVDVWLYQAEVDESRRIKHGDWLKYLRGD